MAQDNGSLQTGGQEVNIDELEVEILIVAKNPNGLKQTCSFLSRRGWPTVALGNISKAIEEIADKKPDIVMISLNHPSPAVMKLPDLIAQSFNLICVGFVESNDATSAGKLQAMKLRHKIAGTPSGPNFHRGIRKILAEKFNIKVDEKPTESEREAKEGPNVTVRGAGDKEKDLAVVGGEKKNRGSLVMGSGSEDAASKGAVESQRGGLAYRPNAGDASGEDAGSGGFALTQAGGNNESLSGAAGGLSGRKRSALFGDDGESGRGSATGADSDLALAGEDVGSVLQMGRDVKRSGDSVVGTGRRKKLKALTATDPHQAPGDMLAGESLEKKTERELRARDAGTGTGTGTGADAELDLVEQIKHSLFDQHAAETTPAGQMEKAVGKALGDVFKPEGETPEALKTIRRIGVFPVDSATLPGYLVLALDGSLTQDARFLQTCENGLRANLNAMGVPGFLEQGFWLDVPVVSFSEWTENAAVFNFRLNHQGREVGVSFFQTEKPIAKAQASEHKEMMTIPLAEISSEETVTFNAYLHLKENNRFYLYLRGGRTLPPERKQRLEAGGLASVYMKVADVDNFRMFLAAAYLKETIRASAGDRTGEGEDAA